MSKTLEKAIAQWMRENPDWEPEPGAIIGHSSDELAYKVEIVSGGQAHCFYINKDGVKVEKLFSCREILDVKAVRDIAVLLAFNRILSEDSGEEV